MIPIDQLELITSERAVIRDVHRYDSATRIELARSTGLSTQSLTRITKHLLDIGLLVEGERRIVGRGQPAIDLEIRPNSIVSFGVVIEHDQITCVVTELGGEQIVSLKRRGPYHKAENALAEVRAMLKAAISESPEDAVALGVGISVSGFFIEEASRRFVSRNDVEGWRAIDLTECLALPIDMPVFVENDGRAAAIGQAVGGIGRRIDSFFSVLMTKGIGGGFICNGEIVRGRLGNAGEIASLMPRSLGTTRPTTENLTEFLRKKWGAAPTDARIDIAVQEGDPVILDWLNGGAVASLEHALNVVTSLLDPKAIIFAGRLSPSIRQALADRVTLKGVNFEGFQAQLPAILVDPKTDCLSVGAAALPVAAFFYSR